jgi:hypothetical protein
MLARVFESLWRCRELDGVGAALEPVARTSDEFL